MSEMTPEQRAMRGLPPPGDGRKTPADGNIVIGPGVYPDIPDHVYHADNLCAVPTLSNTIGKELLRSPLHAWTISPRLNPDHEPRDTKAFRIGKAAHSVVLGRGAEFVTCPHDLLDKAGNMTTAAAKTWKAEQEAAGRIVLKVAEIAQVQAMADVLERKLSEYGIGLDPARSELTVIGEVEGVLCRCRVDNAPADPVAIPGFGKRKIILDYKTIEDASPDACQKQVESYGYNFQGQFYPEVWKAATGEDRMMVFVFQEKKPPHEVQVVALLKEPGHSGDFGEAAQQQTAVARALWRECIGTNVWSGYPTGILVIGQRWSSQKWQDRAAMLSQSSTPTRAALEAWHRAQAPQSNRNVGE